MKKKTELPIGEVVVEDLMDRAGRANELAFNAQAVLDFKLLGNTFQMAFLKLEATNMFVVLPTEMSTEGMTIKEMVDAINKFSADYDPSVGSDLSADEVEKAVKDMSEATEKKDPTQDGADNALDFTKIKVKLQQAFLLLRTGEKMEYALQISVDTTDLFPKQTFISVDGVSLGVWNTSRAKILSRMNIIDAEKYLEENT